MLSLTRYARVDEGLCNGCGICELVCIAECISIAERLPRIDLEYCNGCMNCLYRCPEDAITMKERTEPKELYIDPKEFDQKQISDICEKANMTPEVLVCGCHDITAAETAAAILKGAKTPTDITRMTGARTGCKSMCIQPILRLLKGAGVEVPKSKGWQWYEITPAIYEVPDATIEKYQVFRMRDDVELVNRILKGGEKA